MFVGFCVKGTTDFKNLFFNYYSITVFLISLVSLSFFWCLKRQMFLMKTRVDFYIGKTLIWKSLQFSLYFLYILETPG